MHDDEGGRAVGWRLGGGGFVGLEGADGGETSLRPFDVPLIVRDSESDAANDGGLLLSAATSPHGPSRNEGSFFFF